MKKGNKIAIDKVEMYTVDMENKLDLRRRAFYLLGCNKGRRDSLLVYVSLDNLEKGLFIRNALLYTYVYSATYRRRQTPVLVPYEVTSNWRTSDSSWIRYGEEICGEEKLIYHKGLYTFDLTEIVRDWYHHSRDNNGILLQYKEEAINSFIKIRGYLSGQQYNSKLVIECGEPAEENQITTLPKRVKSLEEKENVVFQKEHFTTSKYILDNEKTSFFIRNTGTHDIKANVQVSPIDEEYLDEDQPIEVKSGTMMVLSPKHHAKYARIHLMVSDGIEGQVQLWYLAQ